MAALLQGVQVPSESVQFIQIANPWPNRTVCFKPSLELPLCVSSTLFMSSGPVVWATMHNLKTEPVLLNAGHRVDTWKLQRLLNLRGMQLVLDTRVRVNWFLVPFKCSSIN